MNIFYDNEVVSLVNVQVESTVTVGNWTGGTSAPDLERTAGSKTSSVAITTRHEQLDLAPPFATHFM